MGVSFSSTTAVFNPTKQQALITDADALLGLGACGLPGAIYKALSESERKELLPLNHMRSRGAFASQTAGKIAAHAGGDLPFLSGSDGSNLRWKLPCGEGEQPYAHALGYLFDSTAMPSVVEAIDRMFEWSRSHVDVLVADDFLGYFDSADRIIEGIDTRVAFGQGVGSEVEGLDGEGAFYLFSWLHSIQQVIRTAQRFDLNVLHTTKVSWLDL